MSEHVPVFISSNYYFHTFRGRLIQSDDLNYRICSHFLYEWLRHLDRFDWLNHIQLSSFEKNLFLCEPLAEADALTDFEKRFFAFPIHETDVLFFHSICDFISFYQNLKDNPFVERIEKVIVAYESSIPRHKLKELIEFILFIEEKTTERLRILFSKKIKEVLLHKE